ncbi:hypothetical protein [Thauera sp. Sel9]|uniref:hypothetical protein n=1 Tax=Thauera sp. Sel9 TaxID=2974299 RepID=UPI0021E17A98|nr:hypothetical protein [Thauera sp. Sel9]MCV2216411.1 hypothetical protein [Thauera sp. Sel9]
MNARALRQLAPPIWAYVLYALLLAVFLGMTLYPFLSGRSTETQTPWPATWVVIAAVWSWLVGQQMCLTAHRMLPLRLPRIASSLRKSVGLHAVVGVALPVLTVQLWQPSASMLSALAAALWLGSAISLLTLSLPVPLAVVPALVLILGWDHFDAPAVQFVAGSIALLLAELCWRWHLSRLRPGIWAPCGAWLGGRSLQASLPLQTGRRSPPVNGSPAGMVSSASPVPARYDQDLLARMLGRRFQTFRQAYGRRGQWLIWLLVAGCIAGLLALGRVWPEPAWGKDKVAILAIMLMLLIDHSQHMVDKLLTKRRTQWVELYLAPGLPPRAHLEGAVMRQIFRCVGERVLLLALFLPAVVQLSYSLNMWWALWWVCFALIVLLQGVHKAWLSWHGRPLSAITLWATARIAGFFALSLSTNLWLLQQHSPYGPMSYAWTALGWVIYLGAMLAHFRTARRRINTRTNGDGWNG